MIGEVSVIAVKPDEIGDRETEVSRHEITPKAIQAIPRANNDVFSAIKYLPGIEGTEPYSPLFSARGGDPGENAILLDGVMIYNPYHSLNNSGIFNMLTIKNVDLFVGGFGAEYGGRNSSVLHLTTNDGNQNEMHGEIEPSTFQSKGFLELPAGKNASVMLAGRYYYDIFFNFLLNTNSYFYDFNASYTNRINNRNRLTVKFFQSKDRTGISFNTFYRYLGESFDTDIYDNFDMRILNNWTNRAGTVILKTVLSPKLYLRSQVYGSYHNSGNLSSLNFSFNTEIDGLNYDLLWKASSLLNSEITDLGAKAELRYTPGKFNVVKIGAEYNNYHFRNGTQIDEIDYGTAGRYPQLTAFFAEDKMSIGPVILKPGIRLSSFDGGDWIAEPRINIAVNATSDLKFKLAWGEYNQFIMSLNTSEIELNQSVDYYYPLQNKPGKSIHYIAGVERNITPRLIASMDIYYKDIRRVYTFDFTKNLSLNEIYAFTDKLEQGKGEAYGLEFLLRGEHRKFSGWASYGLSRSYRQYPHINSGEKYEYEYNRNHSLKIFVNYQWNSRLSYSGTFTYLSGQTRSIESTLQSYYYYDPLQNQMNYFPLYVSHRKNNARMPGSMNLDFSIIKKVNKGFAKNWLNT
ncbi:MAG: TonB-dependent receptor plug domain-containing protein [Bacteroidales bacterium]|nr:TonB-dependent receptor plug domain-containing protein [Bacteroidales bacterium]